MCLAPCSPGSLGDSAWCRLPTHTLFSYRDARRTLVCSARLGDAGISFAIDQPRHDSTRSCSKSPQSSCTPSRLQSAPVPGWFACPGETCMHAARSKRSGDGVQYPGGNSFPSSSPARTRRENDIRAARAWSRGGAESSIKRSCLGCGGSAVDWPKKLVFRPITKSKGLKPAAAGQPSPGDESNNRGGGCSTCTPCSFGSVGWFTARRGWAGASHQFRASSVPPRRNIPFVSGEQATVPGVVFPDRNRAILIIGRATDGGSCGSCAS